MDLEQAHPSVALLGCGHWGTNLARNFSDLGALAAVSDPNGSSAAGVAASTGCRVASVEDILEDSTIQAVAIAAPAGEHYRLASRCLRGGKDVFVEKPLALHPEEAEDLCRAADESQRILMVGHLMQYHPAFLALRQLTTAGQLGQLRYVYSNRLNLGRFRQEEDILWSFAPHDISMILSLMEAEPLDVDAVGSYHLSEERADVTMTHLTFSEGRRGHVYVSWLHPYKEQRLVVVGEEGMAVFDDGEPWETKLRLYPHSVSWSRGVPEPIKASAEPVVLDRIEPLRAECQHFLECIIGRSRPRTDGREGLRVLRVLHRAAGSMEKGRRREVSDRSDAWIHESAIVDAGCHIGRGTKIWHFSHILSGSQIGEDCSIGQNVMIGPEVTVGDRCKIQNNVSVYKGVTLEDGVFCGPSCVFTNVVWPRAEFDRSGEFAPTLVRQGATIGANATVVCGNTVGSYSFIAAGAVVTGDVPDFGLMAGVPARRVGWVGHAGEKLDEDLVCPRTGRQYVLTADGSLAEAND